LRCPRRSSRTFLNFTRSSSLTLWDLLEPSRTLRVLLEPSRTLLELLEPSLWDPRSPCQNFFSGWYTDYFWIYPSCFHSKVYSKSCWCVLLNYLIIFSIFLIGYSSDWTSGLLEPNLSVTSEFRFKRIWLLVCLI